MTDQRKLLIPKRLDDPPRFLWWDFDVAIIAMGSVVLGIMAGFFFSFLFIGMVIAFFYSKMKSGRHRAFGLHLTYWFLPINMGFKRTPSSSVREFIG